MTRQARLGAFTAAPEVSKPLYGVLRAIVDMLHRSTDELIASGAATAVLKAGDIAGSLALKDPDGKPVAPAAVVAERALVVSFCRGVWCPYCNWRLRPVEAALPSFRELSANLVAISPQNPATSGESMRTNKLEFPILVDPGDETVAVFSLRFALQDYRIERSAFDGDTSWSLLMPGRFVIGQDRVIRHAEFKPDYTTAPSPPTRCPPRAGKPLTLS